MNDDYTPGDRFEPRDYFPVLSRIVKEPGNFYASKTGERSIRKPMGILVLSSLFFTAASVISAMPRNPLIIAVILFVNTVVMVFVTSGIGYVAIALMRRTVSYKEVFGVYAYASGAVLTLSWMPFMIWITEPWRWWLIGCGLMNKCGLGLKTTLSVIFLSLIILLLVFWLIPSYLVPK